MSQKLEDVDWAKLGVPNMSKWLIDFASDNLQTHNAAYNELVLRFGPWPVTDPGYGNMDDFKYVLRNDVPQLVVPFLIELLADENISIKNKLDIFELLDVLAYYVFGLPVFTRADDPKDDIYRTRARLIRKAVHIGIPIYRIFLDMPDSLYDSEKQVIKGCAEELLRILKSENLDEI